MEYVSREGDEWWQGGISIGEGDVEAKYGGGIGAWEYVSEVTKLLI